MLPILEECCPPTRTLPEIASLFLKGGCCNCSALKDDCSITARLSGQLARFLPLPEWCDVIGRRVSCYACLKRICYGLCSFEQARACGNSFFQGVERLANEGEAVFAYEAERIITLPFVVISFDETGAQQKTEIIRTVRQSDPIVWLQDPNRTRDRFANRERERFRWMIWLNGLNYDAEGNEIGKPKPVYTDSRNDKEYVVSQLGKTSQALDQAVKLSRNSQLWQVIGENSASVFEEADIWTVAEALTVGFEGLIKSGIDP